MRTPSPPILTVIVGLLRAVGACPRTWPFDGFGLASSACGGFGFATAPGHRGRGATSAVADMERFAVGPEARGSSNFPPLSIWCPLAGIEPALLAESDFESDASTSSAIGARNRESGEPAIEPRRRSRVNRPQLPSRGQSSAKRVRVPRKKRVTPQAGVRDVRNALRPRRGARRKPMRKPPWPRSPSPRVRFFPFRPTSCSPRWRSPSPHAPGDLR